MSKWVIQFADPKSKDNGKYADNENGELVEIDKATIYTDFDAAKADISAEYEMVVLLSDVKG
jgi:hypothetical protein